MRERRCVRTALHMRVTTSRCVSQSCRLHIFAFFFSFPPAEEEAGGDCTGGSPRVTANARVSGYVCISSAPGNPRLQTSLSSCACTPLTPCANMHALVFSFMFMQSQSAVHSVAYIFFLPHTRKHARATIYACTPLTREGVGGVQGWME